MKRKHPFKLSYDEIDVLLMAKGWYQSDLAEYLECHQSTISRWLNERKSPSRRHQLKLVQLWDETFRLQPA